MSRTVAIYARVSTEHEAQLSALDNQVQYYDGILSSHPDWKLYKRYIDEGITGTSIKKRKNFLKMMEDANNGCFDLIITREVSRFARNTVDTLQETRKLKKIGVEVYFTEDNIWTFNDEDGELKLTIMATLAQNESKKTSQRVKAGQKISFENGVIYGTGNILGYDKIGKEMIVNDEQSKTVKFIFESYLKGMGLTEIKDKLESMGHKTATGLSRWNVSCINRVLKNPFYCGTIVYRKSYVPDYLEQKPKKNNGEVEQVIKEGKHQPLVSKEDFNKVQELIKSHSTCKEKKDDKIGSGIPKSVWSKKLLCECGSSFNRRTYHKKDDGSMTFAYHCYKQKNMGSLRSRLKKGLSIDGACDTPMVQEWKLYLMANVIFNLIWNDKEQIISIANKLIDETIIEEDYSNELDEKITENNKKMEFYKNKHSKLLELYLNEMINKDIYIKKKEELDISISRINKENSELISKRGIPKNILKDKIENLKQCIIDNLNYHENNVSDDIIDNFVENVIVHKDKFEWKLAYLNDTIDMNINGRQKSSKLDLYVNNILLRSEQGCGTSSNQKKKRKLVK